MITDQATFAMDCSPARPDHKKFRTSRYFWLIHGLEKTQQDNMYHIVASSTLLTITIRPAKEILAKLQLNNFRRIQRCRGAICCSGASSIPT